MSPNWLDPGRLRTMSSRGRRLLTPYLVVTTCLFAAGVISALALDAGVLNPTEGTEDYRTGNVTGGVVAVVLGVVALGLLYLPRNRPATERSLGIAMALASAALPIVMAFHVSASAQTLCITAAMFLAMIVRAFRPVAPARIWVLVLTVLVVGALWISPAPQLRFTYLVAVIGIVGAAEVFGSLTSNLVEVGSRDPLTGLRNRIGFEVAAAEVLGALPPDSPMSLIVIDLDGFKSVNDTHGHSAGDELLQAAARAWAEALPDDAVLGRIGGDEFVVLLPGRTGQRAAETVRHLQQAHPARWSFGIAEAHDGADLAARYRQADLDLYRRRQADGRSGATPRDEPSERPDMSR